MGDRVELKDDELQLFNKLEKLIQESRDSIKSHKLWGKEQENR